MKNITYRPATPQDAGRLVDFVLMAGEGLPEITWASMAEDKDTLRDVGLRRAGRDQGAFSWRNATLFSADDKVQGGMVGYLLPDAPAPIGPDFPREYLPLQELENLACSTWYVNILGVYDGARGQGIGAAMLARADQIAADLGAKGTSIIVFSTNPGAERLYRRSGYNEVARRRMSIPGWTFDGCDAVLLIKSS